MVKTSVSYITVLSRMIGLWNKLTFKRRRNFILLAGLMVISALAEITSLGIIFPFLGAIAAPLKILNHVHFGKILKQVGITRSEQLIETMTVLFIGIAIITGLIRNLVLHLITKFAFASGADLSLEVYRRTLYQPYLTHISRNSSEIISSLTTKADSIIYDIIFPTLNLVNATTVLAFFGITLMIINPIISLACITIFGLSYLFLAYIQYKRLCTISQTIATKENNIVCMLQEGLGSIRDTLLENSQALLCALYAKENDRLRHAQGKLLFMSGSPRFTMETIGMVTLAGLTYLLCQKGGIGTALPILGVIALGVQRILPSFQQSYNAWTLILGNQSSLEQILILLNQPIKENTTIDPLSNLNFEHEIVLKDVKFSYPNTTHCTINIPSLTIAKGARIGLIGKTGCGKSTLIDLVMGLLSPTEGIIHVDDKPISDENIHKWQKNIAHVPQHLFLTDNSIAENIAFGVPPKKIDYNKVKKVAAQAQLTHFIENLPNQYNTLVGERGVRISGGQRQRIGIARALYKNANILVLDEATSALDDETESLIMNTIDELAPQQTILMIAHRLSTLKNCDVILKLEDGKISEQYYQHEFQKELFVNV